MKANCRRRRHSRRTAAQQITYSDPSPLAQWQNNNSRESCLAAKAASPPNALVLHPDARDGDDGQAAHRVRDILVGCPGLANGVTSSPTASARSNCSTAAAPKAAPKRCCAHAASRLLRSSSLCAAGSRRRPPSTSSPVGATTRLHGCVSRTRDGGCWKRRGDERS